VGREPALAQFAQHCESAETGTDDEHLDFGWQLARVYTLAHLAVLPIVAYGDRGVP